MTRKKELVFSKISNTKSRRDYIDYDYIDSLSEVHQKYLAQFTGEYYCSDYDYSPVYVKKSDLVPFLRQQIKKLSNSDKKYAEKKLDKIVKTFASVINEPDGFIQIYKNEKNKLFNLDLRTTRTLTLYYNNDGVFTTDEIYKYTPKNIHKIYDAEIRDDCNKRTISARDDLLNNRFIENLDNKWQEPQGDFKGDPERYMIFKEEAEFYPKYSDFDEDEMDEYYSDLEKIFN